MDPESVVITRVSTVVVVSFVVAAVVRAFGSLLLGLSGYDYQSSHSPCSL
jgi:hypothetical protein